MDRLESLSSTLSQMTFYDVKSLYNQAKNVVLNVSEMEAKVREATNDEPWGASSTLMQDIAQGTFNFQNFNEIMPCIYSRFMEKEAKQWREIYKALQLLEYLIKNGSERVVDDARSHIATIKMLRSFHYIDDKGKDQGINVRNRAKEIAELLSDVEKIRTERRKAKSNRTKYIGTGNDALSFTSSSGSRYGGFGSDSLGGGGGSSSYGGGSAGFERDYGGYGGSSGGFRDERKPGPGGFEEYDAGDDETTTTTTAPRRSASLNQSRPTGSGVGRVNVGSTRRGTAGSGSAPAPPAKEKQPEKVVDLLGFDDDGFGDPVSAPAPLAAPAPMPSLDDDFGDFEAAPPSAPASPPVPQATSPPVAKQSLMEMLDSTSSTRPTVPTTTAPAFGATMGGYNPTGAYGANRAAPPANMNRQSMGMGMGMTAQPTSPSYVASTPVAPNYAPNPSFFSAQPMKPSSPPPRTGSSVTSPTSSTMGMGAGGRAPVKSPSAATASFDDLWSMSLGNGLAKPATPTGTRSGSAMGMGTTGGKSIKDLEKEKAMAGIWGSGSGTGGAAGRGGNGWGAMGGGTTSSSSGGGDDLLL